MSLTCPICYENITKGFFISHCMHTFCLKCIEKAVSYKKECPMCRRKLYYTIIRNDESQENTEIIYNEILDDVFNQTTVVYNEILDDVFNQTTVVYNDTIDTNISFSSFVINRMYQYSDQALHDLWIFENNLEMYYLSNI